MKKKSPDRRRPRYDVGVETMCIGADDRSKVAVSRNISDDGIFVECPDPIEPGEQVQLFMLDPQHSNIFRVNADVVRVEAGVGFGARFKTRNARIELDRFIDHLVAA